MTRPATFTQAELRRALKAARDTGFPVAGFRVTAEGIEVTFGEPGKVKSSNPWDQVLHETPKPS